MRSAYRIDATHNARSYNPGAAGIERMMINRKSAGPSELSRSLKYQLLHTGQRAYPPDCYRIFLAPVGSSPTRK
jgi:hypothetical protein